VPREDERLPPGVERRTHGNGSVMTTDAVSPTPEPPTPTPDPTPFPPDPEPDPPVI